jgi:hypothetical protein
MTDSLNKLLAEQVDWFPSPSKPFHFIATVNGTQCELRLNDFPDENIGTLLLQGRSYELEEIPRSWRLPKHRGE